MERRAFLGLLTRAGAALGITTICPEVITKAVELSNGSIGMSEAQILALELARIYDRIPSLFDWDNTFYSIVESKESISMSGKDMHIPLELKPYGKYKKKTN